jgi:hypothetical protein
MTTDGSAIDRLRGYLQSLAPEARAMLIAELERGLLRGDESAGSDLVLQELRRTIRTAAQPVPRIGDAARRFFLPLEPLLIDGPADHKRAGRLARVSLEPIWQWIGRDLIPAETKALSEDIHRALVAEDDPKVELLVRALHERAVQRMNETLAAIGSDERARRRFGVQVGTPRAVEDVTTLAHVLGFRDVLAELARRLPDHIRTFERDQADQVKSFVDSAVVQKPAQNPAGEKSDLHLYGLLLTLNHLAAPWQLIRIAVCAAESDDVARIAATPYGAAVTIVLGELECTLGELRSELKAGRPIASLLKGLHDAARGLRTEMNLSGDSAWARQLAAIRSSVASLLTAEIESAPGRVRRLLRPRALKETGFGSFIDPGDVQEAEARLELVNACRNYAGELAMSEVTLRTYSELTQYLETGTKVLLDALRHADEAERPLRQAQVDAAVRFCRVVFGADYAGLLAKAAEVAAQSAATERRSVRA